MKILIVDDSLLDRKIMLRTLEKGGIDYQQLQAEDGEEAMTVLSQHYRDIHLILLDWQMPKMSGMEFMEGFVKIEELKHIPIVMVTASGTDENRAMAYRVNPDLAGYIVKPFNPADVVSLVKSILNTHG